jgi:hypothetical protein
MWAPQPFWLGWQWEKISSPCQESNPGCPTCSLFTVLIELSWLWYEGTRMKICLLQSVVDIFSKCILCEFVHCIRVCVHLFGYTSFCISVCVTGAQVMEFCPHGTKVECTKVNSAEPCKKLHFKKIIQKHTDESLGDCSFLNTCFHMDTCKYVSG